MAEAAARDDPKPLVHASVGRRMVAFFIDLLLIYGVVLVIANLTDRTVGYSPLGFKFGGLGTVLILLGAILVWNGRWSQRLGDRLGRTVVLEQHSDRTFVPRVR